MDAATRRRLQLVVPVSIAVTVFAVACGSSSIHSVHVVGKTIRWVALLALLGVVLWQAWPYRRRLVWNRLVVALACALLVLVLVSAAWSVDPRLSFGRGVSLAILFAVAALLAAAAAAERRNAELVLTGLVAGAVAVAVAGLLVLAVDHDAAVQYATLDLPTRFRGFGENPDTASLLFALALPLALWRALCARTRSGRWVGVAIVLLLYGSLVASLSRGALAAAAAGLFLVAVLVPSSRKERLVVVAGVAALVVAGILGETIPSPATTAPAAAPAVRATRNATPKHGHAPRYVNVDTVLPLDFDVGSEVPGESTSQPRRFLGTGGRAIAWRGALDLVDGRPILGYGFGTEDRVFVDRYALFTGGLVENAFIGIALQLGVVGLALLVTLVAAAAATAFVRVWRDEELAAACLGVVVAGVILAVVQSFVYSVGDIGAATFWIATFVGAAGFTVAQEPR